MSHPPPAKAESADGSPPPSGSASGPGVPSSLLHLLADASSELPSRIGSSYHLSENPPPGLPSPSGSPRPEALVNGKKRKAGDSDAASDPGKKDKAKGPPAKAVLSCQECRRLKLKCDRVFPCSCCKKRGVATICPDGELKGGKGKRLILASTVELHARISALEQALHDDHCQLTGSTVPHPLLASSFHFEPLDEVDSGPLLPSTLGNPAVPLPNREPIDGVAPDGTARSNYGSLTMSDEPGRTVFYGPAGSQYFLADDNSSATSGQAVNRPTSNDPYVNAFSSSSSSATVDDLQFGLHQTPSGLTDSFPFEGAPASTQVSLDVLKGYLPSRELAWSLVEMYYRNASWQHEDIVPKDSFYQSFFPHVYPSETPAPPVNNHRLAVVFMILATSSLFDLNAPPQSKSSRKYYALARACLAWNSTASVAMVQALHLMVNFLMHSEKATVGGEASWPLLRLAVAASQSIGLHRDGANWNLRPEEVEERRRVFWEINAYDIQQSISLGRPRAMSAATIDAKFPGAGSENPLLTASQQKYLFCSILTQINDLQTNATIGTYFQVSKIDREIRAFEKNLPTSLHCTEDSCVLPEDGEDWDAKKMILQRYGNLLMINAALLFTHRGCFARALRDHPDEPLKSKFSQSYVAELEASKVLISILRDVLKLQLPLVSRFWIFFFHSFSAAASLAVAVIRAPKSSLAKAAYEEVELAVSLFETAKIGSRARDELPTLQRLRDRARDQLRASQSKSSSRPKLSSTLQPSANDLDLLGSETTLHRRAPPPSTADTTATPPTHASSMTDSPAATVADQDDPLRLPTTLEEAVAAHDFGSFSSFGGQGLDGEMYGGGGGGDTSWMTDPMPFGEGASGMESFGFGGVGQNTGMGMMGGGAPGFGISGLGNDHFDFSFDDFIAGLGVNMNEG